MTDSKTPRTTARTNLDKAFSLIDRQNATITKLETDLSAALARAEEKDRVLLVSDSFCPSCGHNRDTSSVSSIELPDGKRQCQICKAKWSETDRALEGKQDGKE